jgi:hypothetical protein
VIRSALGGLARRLGLRHGTARPGGPVAGIDLDECQVFFGYCRIHAYAMLAEVERYSHAELLRGLRVALELEGGRPAQRAAVLSVQPSGAVEFELDALVRRDMPMDRAVLLVWFRDGLSRFPLSAVLPFAQSRDLTSRLGEFNTIVAAAAAGGRRPRLLDVGGRARSCMRKSEIYPHCDVTVFDIIPDPGVDVVGDAHELSSHFPPESFDFATSLAVFEHLLMPWKAAVELNRVLKPGAHAYVWSHQSQPIHDLPWDFFRFSDNAWHALFNRRTGFEVVAADMSMKVHLVPRVYPSQSTHPEDTLGFMASEVLVRKTGPAEVDWPVRLSEVIDTMYPTDPPGAPAAPQPGGAGS